MKLRPLFALLAVAALALPQLAFAPPPASVAEATPWVSTAPIHPIAGRVTIEAPAGLSGIRLDTSGQVVRPMGEDLVVDSYDGAAAFIVGARQSGPEMFDPRELWVMDWHTISADLERQEDGSANGNGSWFPQTKCHRSDDPEVYGVPCPVEAPYLDYYIATDEPIVFTLAFAGDDLEPLPGHVTYTPDGAIDGELVNMVGTCPTGDCGKLHFGGMARSTYGYDEAFGAVVSMTYTRDSLERLPTGHRAATTTRTAGLTCIYPSLIAPGNSPDPDDHPLGCTMGAGVSQSSHELQVDTYSLVYVTEEPTFGGRIKHTQIHKAVHGPQYVGFHLRNWQTVDAFGEGSTGRWAFWLNPGIH